MSLNSFSSGVNTSFSSELNDNFDYLQVKNDESSADTSEVTTSSLSFTTIRTHTFTPSDNAILLRVEVDFDMKTNNVSGAADAQIATTIGTISVSDTTSTSYVDRSGSVNGNSAQASSFTISYQAKNAGSDTTTLTNMKTTVYYLYADTLTTSSSTIAFS